MRTRQASLRVEIFDEDQNIRFSVYSDSNDLSLTLGKLLKKSYKHISKTKNIGTYEDFIDSLKHPEQHKNELGVCELVDL